MKKLIFFFALMMPLVVFADPPFVTDLQGTSGSAVGPGGELYVTDGLNGQVWRVDPDTGSVSLFASNLPLSPLQGFIGFGGAVDVAFIGETAYVLVTGVGFPFGPSIDGVYRVDGWDANTVIADIGTFSAADVPDAFPVDLPNGLQYALETYRGGFLVTDGHHNRVLRVTLDGEVSEFLAFDEDVVPTGLAVSGNTVYLAEAGPIPHDPEDGKVVSFGPNSPIVTEATGAPLLVDVERGPGRTLFALSQGEFPADGVPAQSANEDTGALLEANGDGTFDVVAGGLNLPTSVEIIKNTAYVVTLGGEILKIDDIAGPPYGTSRRE